MTNSSVTSIEYECFNCGSRNKDWEMEEERDRFGEMCDTVCPNCGTHLDDGDRVDWWNKNKK